LPQLFVDWILALELWWVSLGLFAISIGLAIEVYGRFSKTFRQMEEKRLKAVRGRMREIIARAEKSRMEDVEDRILGMQDQYVSAKAPRRALMESVEYFFFASVLYLASVLVRGGMDYGWMTVQSYGPAEAILFLMGLVFFAIACLSAYRFMRLVEHESVD
jgi:hypothetical protein